MNVIMHTEISEGLCYVDFVIEYSIHIYIIIYHFDMIDQLNLVPQLRLVVRSPKIRQNSSVS